MKQRNTGGGLSKPLRGGRCISERIRACLYKRESDLARSEICVGSISRDCNYRISVRLRQKRRDRIFKALNLSRAQSSYLRASPRISTRQIRQLMRLYYSRK